MYVSRRRKSNSTIGVSGGSGDRPSSTQSSSRMHHLSGSQHHHSRRRRARIDAEDRLSGVTGTGTGQQQQQQRSSSVQEHKARREEQQRNRFRLHSMTAQQAADVDKATQQQACTSTTTCTGASNPNVNMASNERLKSASTLGAGAAESEPLLTAPPYQPNDHRTPVAEVDENPDDNTTTECSAACRLNIGGKQFRVRLRAVRKRLGADKQAFLQRFVEADHSTRLSNCDEYWSHSDEYYFERSPRLFEPIFDWITSGTLHKPVDICAVQFLDELAFWQVHRSHISYCCVAHCSTSRSSIASQGVVANGRRRYTYDNHGSPLDPMMFDGTKEEENGDNDSVDDEFSNVCCGSLRASLWDLTEDPSTSKAAKIFAILSIGFVLLSVIGLILGSMPDLQMLGQTYQNEDGEVRQEMVPHTVLQYMEYCCIGWFTMEYLLRFCICTHKWMFFKEALNLIDFVTIAPFYMELALGMFGMDVNRLSNIKGAVLVMRIVRVLRVARVFKLARYSTGLKSFGTTVQNSVQELSMLFLFLITAIIFFSTIVYFLEKDEPNTHFRSIPDAMWWCIVTMTTVGYGDSVPVTALGKVVASFASISGVLVLAFPITMIVENFSKSYDKATDTEAAGRRKHRRSTGIGNTASLSTSNHHV